MELLHITEFTKENQNMLRSTYHVDKEIINYIKTTFFLVVYSETILVIAPSLFINVIFHTKITIKKI